MFSAFVVASPFIRLIVENEGNWRAAMSMNERCLSDFVILINSLSLEARLRLWNRILRGLIKSILLGSSVIKETLLIIITAITHSSNNAPLY